MNGRFAKHNTLVLAMKFISALLLVCYTSVDPVNCRWQVHSMCYAAPRLASPFLWQIATCWACSQTSSCQVCRLRSGGLGSKKTNVPSASSLFHLVNGQISILQINDAHGTLFKVYRRPIAVNKKRFPNRSTHLSDVSMSMLPIFGPSLFSVTHYNNIF